MHQARGPRVHEVKREHDDKEGGPDNQRHPAVLLGEELADPGFLFAALGSCVCNGEVDWFVIAQSVGDVFGFGS